MNYSSRMSLIHVNQKLTGRQGRIQKYGLGGRECVASRPRPLPVPFPSPPFSLPVPSPPLPLPPLPSP